LGQSSISFDKSSLAAGRVAAVLQLAPNKTKCHILAVAWLE
jgi:hypothetical protein